MSCVCADRSSLWPWCSWCCLATSTILRSGTTSTPRSVSLQHMQWSLIAVQVCANDTANDASLFDTDCFGNLPVSSSHLAEFVLTTQNNPCSHFINRTNALVWMCFVTFLLLWVFEFYKFLVQVPHWLEMRVCPNCFLSRDLIDMLETDLLRASTRCFQHRAADHFCWSHHHCPCDQHICAAVG